MQGFSIVFFAVQSMFRDLGVTFRLTVLPWLLVMSFVFCIFQLLTGAGLEAGTVTNAASSPGYVPAFALSLFVLCMVGSWVGLSWHRHVLLRESAGSVLPKRNSQAFEYYFDAAMKFALLSFAVVMMIKLLMMPLVPIMGFFGPGAKVISLAINALLVSILLRYALILPAAALEQPITMGDSWEATQGYHGPIYAIAFFIVLVVDLAGLVPGQGLATTVLEFSAAWASLVLCISVVTVLYGVRVEGRRLIV